MAAMSPIAIEDVPPVDRTEATSLAAAEYERVAALLHALPPETWDLPTDCTRWSVRDVAAHIVGETEAFASPREFVHQWLPAARVRREVGSPWLIDGVNELQVRDRRTSSPAELVARLVAAAPRAIRTRARLPRPLRAVPVVFPPPIGRRTVAYLVDLVITRDVWMHRVDIARATGAELVLTAAHDGRIIADVVADWSATHPDPFLLELTGPAGGTYGRGEVAAPTALDAVDFVRIVSGRERGEGVLARPLPL
jgi:uncharacterized protein (TIGR03083 family)